MEKKLRTEDSGSAGREEAAGAPRGRPGSDRQTAQDCKPSAILYTSVIQWNSYPSEIRTYLYIKILCTVPVYNVTREMRTPPLIKILH